VCRTLTSGQTGADWLDLPDKLREAISSVQACDDEGHVYLLFRNEESLIQSLQTFPVLRQGMKLCHALDKSKDIPDEDFLPEDQQIASLRNHLHLQVIYQDGETADLFILRGENSQHDMQTIRSRLAPYEKLIQFGVPQPPFGCVPQGKFPYHATGAGEGYPWVHINEYALYTQRSARCAWGSISRLLQFEDTEDIEAHGAVPTTAGCSLPAEIVDHGMPESADTMPQQKLTQTVPRRSRNRNGGVKVVAYNKSDRDLGVTFIEHSSSGDTHNKSDGDSGAKCADKDDENSAVTFAEYRSDGDTVISL